MSTASGIGAAVGLAVLVLVANAGARGLGGEALRIAAAGGIRAAVLTIAAGIGATFLITLTLHVGAPPRHHAPPIDQDSTTANRPRTQHRPQRRA